MAIFDQAATDYDQWYQSKLGTFVDEVETQSAFDLFQAKKGQRVLDVGCGTGNFSQKLARMGCKVTGIDLSQSMLEIAKAKTVNEGLDIDFQVMDVYRLDFTDKYFDAVFSMAAFEFIQYPEKAISELFRVTKKGGKLLIGTINGDSPWGELYTSQKVKKDSVFRYAFFKTPEEMKSLRKENLLAIRQCLFVPPDIREEEITWEKEKALSQTERGGFLCALWKK